MPELPCGHTEGTRMFLVEPKDSSDARFEREVCLICGRWVGDKPLSDSHFVLKEPVQYFTPEKSLQELLSE